MAEEEFVLALLGIIAGTVIAGITIGGFFSLVKTWINRKKSDSEFKRNTERRLETLEEIVIDEDVSTGSQSKQKDSPSIQIEDTEVRGDKSKQKDSSNLRNMLDE